MEAASWAIVGRSLHKIPKAVLRLTIKAMVRGFLPKLLDSPGFIHSEEGEEENRFRTLGRWRGFLEAQQPPDLEADDLQAGRAFNSLCKVSSPLSAPLPSF